MNAQARSAIFRRIYPCWALSVLAVSAWGQHDPAPAHLDDGYDVAEWSAILDPMRDQRIQGVDRDMVIADSTGPNVLFGMYRASQMTEPGWTLFDARLDHVCGGCDPATTRVWLATYNGTLDNGFSAERDGIAVYNRLINTLGYQGSNVHVAHQESIETGDFTGYDIVVYAWAFPRNATNVVNQGKPFLTLSVGQSDELGIGTGAETMHESRNHAYVLTDQSDITDSWTVGKFTLAANMFMDATTVAGNGVVLVGADPRIPCADIKKFKTSCRRGKLKAILVFLDESHDGQQISFSVAPGIGEFNATINRTKAKRVLRDQSGERTVSLLYPESCVEPRSTTCE